MMTINGGYKDNVGAYGNGGLIAITVMAANGKYEDDIDVYDNADGIAIIVMAINCNNSDEWLLPFQCISESPSASLSAIRPLQRQRRCHTKKETSPYCTQNICNVYIDQ